MSISSLPIVRASSIVAAQKLQQQSTASFSFARALPGTPAFSFIQEQFESVIKPLYGDQSSAIEKIRIASDRIAEVLFRDHTTPVGVLVFKKEPNTEIRRFGVRDPSLEIKSLFLGSAASNSGAGLGSRLLQRVLAYCSAIKCTSIHVTVNAKACGSFNFFTKNRFKVVHEYFNKDANDTEYVLARSLRHHRLPIYGQYFQMIQSGAKTWEGRCNTGMFKRIYAGDTITFACRDQLQLTEVLSVRVFDSFRQMLEDVGVKPMLPDVSNLDQATNIYLRIPGYAQKEREYGVVAFEVRAIARYTGTVPPSPTRPEDLAESSHVSRKRKRDSEDIDPSLSDAAPSAKRRL